MLKLVVESGIPLIEVSTTDLVNVVEVLSHVTGKDFVPFTPSSPTAHEFTYCIGYMSKPSPERLYSLLVEKECVLIIINPEGHNISAYDAGVIPTPKTMVGQLLRSVLPDDSSVNGILPFMGGLTLKDVGEVARLTMSRDGSLTATGVAKTRRLYTPTTRGLTQVDTTTPFYAPQVTVQKWVMEEAPFFLDSPHAALTPRGLLFGGDAGTGKTLGAKHLANELNIPLYRLDIGGLMGKYVGESEGNLTKALNQVDNEAPCIMLIDEVEKIFNNKDDDGVQYRLLSHILWWLQEHTTRVLTIMTTNDVKALPLELYRAGRVDTIITFAGMPRAEAILFAEEYITSLCLDTPVAPIFPPEEHKGWYTPAEVVQHCLVCVKRELLVDK